jgi:heavy metal efflux system protein
MSTEGPQGRARAASEPDDELPGSRITDEIGGGDYISEIKVWRRVKGTLLQDAVIGGARAQFRPRVILIIVAILGMLPAALARGIGSDIQRPLATVVVGGLVSTLFLTLLALPAVYWLAQRWRRTSPSA